MAHRDQRTSAQCAKPSPWESLPDTLQAWSHQRDSLAAQQHARAPRLEAGTSNCSAHRALSRIRVEQALSLCIQGCAPQSNAVINLKLCQFDWLEKLINELVDNLLRSRRHLPSLLCSSRDRFTLSMIDKEFSAPLGDFSTAYSDSGGSALLAE